MTGKFAKISRLEWVTLLLTACFAAGTLLWFHFGPPPGAVTFTGTGEPTAAEQQAAKAAEQLRQAVAPKHEQAVKSAVKQVLNI